MTVVARQWRSAMMESGVSPFSSYEVLVELALLLRLPLIVSPLSPLSPLLAPRPRLALIRALWQYEFKLCRVIIAFLRLRDKRSRAQSDGERGTGYTPAAAPLSGSFSSGSANLAGDSKLTIALPV
ncbi:hypothetical protein NUW54_g609 [Trametes sanguinea]|uniref:Uncharacterized protein n=1 Tax=Trametes sanguinea TaxID=158606 RepID=A0ACC1Q8P1_9APHY|nr:hypothetical protein NUW54_g609 [Trametes sanguinea]